MLCRIVRKSARTSASSTRALPWSGSSKVVRMRNRVLFPAPSGPMRPNSSPCFTLKDTSRGVHLSVTFAYMTDFYEAFHVTLGFQNLTFPYMPSLMCPSFSTAILTAYTWLARSSLVRMVLGVNSASSEIQTILPV